MTRKQKLVLVHRELSQCRACSNMVGPVVHGPPVVSPVLLLGQAPGAREGDFGRPFAWTAGKTLFRWFEEAVGIDEETFRARIYMAAVARCFPGKAKSGGDRVPDADEVARCGSFLSREVTILRPKLVLAVGSLAIAQVLGEKKALVDVVGRQTRVVWYGVNTDVICLPHPSGASTWPRMEPGKVLLRNAMQLVATHPAMRAVARGSRVAIDAGERHVRNVSPRTRAV